jgi:hypothetical protein
VSDLHCAATLVLAPTASLDALVPQLAGSRVALVRCGTSTEALRAATGAAAALGVGLVEDRGLDLAETVDQTLGDIADEHRGETVLVVLDHVDAVTEVAIDNDGRHRRRWTAG